MALARKLSRGGVSSYLTTDRAEVYYLSGFTGEDSALIAAGGDGVLVTDRRFEEQAQKECPGTRVVMREEELARAVRMELPRQGKVGYDPRTTTVAMFSSLGLRRRGRAVPNAVRLLRQHKTDKEVGAITKALHVATAALRAAIRKAKPGWRETDLSGLLEYEMRRRGARGPAFETIILVDERGSLPHGRPGKKRIASGSSVLVDWGARLGMYNSDLTRMVGAGTVKSEVRRLYGLVREAQERAIERIRPGVRACEVDAAARELIEKRGYSRQFGHGLGHGVGLEVHELPVVSSRSRVRLAEGMVFSVEPGIYLPGKVGVRVEDLVVVTKDGCRRLTRLSRGVLRLGDTRNCGQERGHGT
ncbi:MAG: Xaa-Pro peptidase family protein [Planctomycetota bacterium]